MPYQPALTPSSTSSSTTAAATSRQALISRPTTGNFVTQTTTTTANLAPGMPYGLYRNPTDAACFTQHPQPETPRPSFAAYQGFNDPRRDVEPYWRKREGRQLTAPPAPTPMGTQEWIALYQPATKKRIVGLWTRCGRDETAVYRSDRSSRHSTIGNPGRYGAGDTSLRMALYHRPARGHTPQSLSRADQQSVYPHWRPAGDPDRDGLQARRRLRHAGPAEQLRRSKRTGHGQRRWGDLPALCADHF